MNNILTNYYDRCLSGMESTLKLGACERCAMDKKIGIYLSKANLTTLTFPSISIDTASNPHFSV